MPASAKVDCAWRKASAQKTSWHQRKACAQLTRNVVFLVINPHEHIEPSFTILLFSFFFIQYQPRSAIVRSAEEFAGMYFEFIAIRFSLSFWFITRRWDVDRSRVSRCLEKNLFASYLNSIYIYTNRPSCKRGPRDPLGTSCVDGQVCCVLVRWSSNVV